MMVRACIFNADCNLQAVPFFRPLLRKAGRKEQELSHEAKSAGWKVELAAAMKDRTSATNRWLGEAWRMGGLHEVSRLINAWPGK